ncbi:MAG: NAD-dependent epimerase/dehydratase family protein [Chitinophagaceae bacterium]|nr:MAG: NAD-dependent epimerase/dehydratase family protein [Chitinophagaceae bacterium]
MPEKIATVIGSTGLIGNHLLQLLQEDPFFDSVRAVVRRPVQFNYSKIEMKLVDFSDQESVKLAIDGSHAVFVAIGTTQKKVKGDKTAYREVDYDIPVNAARYCAETCCPNFMLVSSVGANSRSNNFYLKLKGEVEDAVQKLSIPNISIFRPSMLVGERKEFRLGEKIAQPLMNLFGFMLIGKWEKYHSIDGRSVARAMVQAAKEGKAGFNIYEYESMLAKSKELEDVTEHQHQEE